MPKKTYKKNRKLEPTGNHGMLRLSPDLALEIGENESIMFLQLEYLVSIGRHSIDGHEWTYQSVSKLREQYFPHWSASRIKRTLSRLIEMGLIRTANYNKKSYDRTRWFALDFQKVSELKSVKVDPNFLVHSGPDLVHSGPDLVHSGPTIPETTAEITTETTTVAGAVDNLSSRENHPIEKQEKEKNFGRFRQSKVLIRKLENRQEPSQGLLDKYCAMYHAGDVYRFRDYQARYDFRAVRGEYPGVRELLDFISDPLLKERMIAFAEHEKRKWDFSRTKNPEVVTLRFYIEFIENAPSYVHFAALKPDDVERDVELCRKRNTGNDSETNDEHFESQEENENLLELWRASR